MYEVEVIAHDGSQVKVHYIGYGSEYDEWRPKSEVKDVPPTFDSSVDEPFSPLKELACLIRSGDPDIHIQTPLHLQSFKSWESHVLEANWNTLLTSTVTWTVYLVINGICES